MQHKNTMITENRVLTKEHSYVNLKFRILDNVLKNITTTNFCSCLLQVSKNMYLTTFILTFSFLFCVS